MIRRAMPSYVIFSARIAATTPHVPRLHVPLRGSPLTAGRIAPQPVHMALSVTSFTFSTTRRTSRMTLPSLSTSFQWPLPHLHGARASDPSPFLGSLCRLVLVGLQERPCPLPPGLPPGLPGAAPRMRAGCLLLPLPPPPPPPPFGSSPFLAASAASAFLRADGGLLGPAL